MYSLLFTVLSGSQERRQFLKGQFSNSFITTTWRNSDGKLLTASRIRIRSFVPLDYAGRRISRWRCKTGGVPFFFGLQSTLVSYLRPSLPRDALINGNAVQPRRNLSLATKGAQISKRRQERLLSCVARVLLATEHAKGKREDSSLPALNNLAESLGVARQRPFYDLLVARSRSYPVLVCKRCRSLSATMVPAVKALRS